MREALLAGLAGLLGGWLLRGLVDDLRASLARTRWRNHWLGFTPGGLVAPPPPEVVHRIRAERIAEARRILAQPVSPAPDWKPPRADIGGSGSGRVG